jgi:hypothetical protein
MTDRANVDAFLAEFEALCRKYDLNIVPPAGPMTIFPGYNDELMEVARDAEVLEFPDE